MNNWGVALIRVTPFSIYRVALGIEASKDIAESPAALPNAQRGSSGKMVMTKV